MIKIRDIVNHENVNIENCEDEAIHIPGQIQPQGFLIGINKSTLICEVCSKNTHEYIDLNVENILGKHVNDLFNEEISAIFNSHNHDTAAVTSVNLNGKEFSLTYFVSGKHFILEAEPSVLYASENVDLYQSSSRLLISMENSSGVIKLANAVVSAVRELTAYDRVMIYRFDREYNGEVIAEAKKNSMPAFLGLHYPHTDIPPQARELYLKNQLRIIGDVDYRAVPLFTSEKSDVQQLDLSLSSLRSVSPIHLEYLKNMDVKATLTVSLVHKGKLWGLIACHHHQAKYLSHAMRSAVKLQGHFITSQIDVRLQNEEYEVSIETNKNVERLLALKLNMTYSSIQDLYTRPEITALCNGAGACAIIGAEVYTYGSTPSKESIKALGSYIHLVNQTNTMHADNLSKIVNDLPSVTSKFPGLVFYSLGNDNDCLMWFRKETIKEVKWAGVANTKLDGTTSLSPRKSFATWSQFVKNRSRPWLKSELNAVQNFYNFFLIHLRNVRLLEENEKQSKLSKILQETTAELESIKWISTHDLQEPLRKIRMMTSMLVDDKGKTIPDSMMAKIVKVQQSAQRMQNLMQGIAKYTKTGKQNQRFEAVNLNLLLNNITTEINEKLDTNNIQLNISELPIVSGIPFLLTQVFTNILYNAIKFTDSNKQACISITCSPYKVEEAQGIQGFHKICISDNGIGFDNQYNEKIFNLFSRLHSEQEYVGTGVGLALCRKILIQHKGFIEAHGEQGKGATFSIYLPQ